MALATSPLELVRGLVSSPAALILALPAIVGAGAIAPTLSPSAESSQEFPAWTEFRIAYDPAFDSPAALLRDVELEMLAGDVANYDLSRPSSAIDIRDFEAYFARLYASCDALSDEYYYVWTVVDGEYVPICYRRVTFEVTSPSLEGTAFVAVEEPVPVL